MLPVQLSEDQIEQIFLRVRQTWAISECQPGDQANHVEDGAGGLT